LFIFSLGRFSLLAQSNKNAKHTANT
jgi:hypothetical protein